MLDQLGAVRSAPLSPSEQSLLDTSRSVLVIGAGFGGIASALRMRARGYDVTLIDRLNAIGGRAQVFERGGFRHDAGPTVITAPFLFDELFALFGERRGIDFIFILANNLITGHLLNIQTKKSVAFRRRTLADMLSC